MLKDGDVLAESDAVQTGKGGSVVLVFSNGSSVKVGSESRSRSRNSKWIRWRRPLRWRGLKAEPTVSQTKLNLAYGEMVGDVKKLNKSSSYSIKTPVGAAGIRGTVYRIVFHPDANGKAFFQVQTLEGLVVMEGVTSVAVPIEEGKDVSVEIDTNNPSTPNVLTQDLTPENKAIIETASKSITQEVINTVIPPATGSTTDPTKDKDPKSDPPKDSKDPGSSGPESPPPTLTSGAGG